MITNLFESAPKLVLLGSQYIPYSFTMIPMVYLFLMGAESCDIKQKHRLVVSHIFFHILGIIIIPIDELHHFSEG